MRKIYLLLLVIIISGKLYAQTYKIDTSEVTFENKLRPCLNVSYDADAKTVKKGWSNFLKKNYKIKTKGIGLFSDKDVISTQDVTINSISDKRMNMYARVTDASGGSDMKYLMSFGYDFFIGPENYPDAFEGMKKLLNDFSVEFLNDYYNDETSDILKKVKKYERDIKQDNRSIKKNDKKSRKASSAESTGLEAKNNANLNDISRTEEKINDLQKRLEEIKIKQKGITRN